MSVEHSYYTKFQTNIVCHGYSYDLYSETTVFSIDIIYIPKPISYFISPSVDIGSGSCLWFKSVINKISLISVPEVFRL